MGWWVYPLIYKNNGSFTRVTSQLPNFLTSLRFLAAIFQFFTRWKWTWLRFDSKKSPPRVFCGSYTDLGQLFGSKVINFLQRPHLIPCRGILVLKLRQKTVASLRDKSFYGLREAKSSCWSYNSRPFFHVEMARCQLTLPKISHGNFQPIPPEPELLGAANLLPGLKIQVADVNLVPCYSSPPCISTVLSK